MGGDGVTGTEIVATEVAIQGIFWSGLTAPLVKATFWKWWKSRLGWSIVSKTLALSASLLLSVLIYYFGPGILERFPWLIWFAIVMLYLVIFVIWWRVYEIYRVQKRGAPHT